VWLYNTRTGRAEEINPGPGRLLRIYACGPAAHVGDLRWLLLADLIRRNAEHRHGLAVLACLVVAGGGFPAEALNLRPAEQTSGPPEWAGPDAGASTPGEVIVYAGGREGVGHSVRAGQVTFDGREMTGSAQPAAPAVRLSDLAGRGLDPLALRLAYLSRRHAERVDLTWDALDGADRALRRWRELVAEWAESPSRPMDAETIARVGAAFDDDLDTPAALRALQRLAAGPGILPGSKFESFLYADQLLGLDLPRDIGRPRYGPGAAAPAAQ
jgi:cysteinyl-tRNA synthetase